MLKKLLILTLVMTLLCTGLTMMNASAAGGVIFYQDINYGGASAELQPGSYTLAQLNAAGIPNDWMSSLKVPAGWTVEVYQNDNFGGTKWTFTESSSWVGSDANDKMSSVKIFGSSASSNVAAGKTVTASDAIAGSASLATDGDKNTDNYIGVTQNLQWIQIDLGQSYDVNKINLWHYFGDGRTYRDVIVRLSNSSGFSSGVTTVFNNDANNSAGLGAGSDAEYAESAAGKSISFNSVNARYVRLYTNGSSSNIYNHYVEVEVWASGGGTTPPPVVTKTMFDDFNYSAPGDSSLSTHGWVVRNAMDEGPGPSGCDFLSSNISFLNDPANSSNRLMRLTATTNGTGSGTKQAEVYTANRKYFKGTYAARVRFTDTPTSGTDGAAINQTFFAISPLEGYRDPNYSECDFEYLPNGGWGSGQGMWTTSWHTYTADPWYKDGSSKFAGGSYAGWHTLVFTVANDGTTTYYIDGSQFTQDTPYYGPRKNMTINFNLWFITGTGEPALVNSTYIEDVDWVFHAKDTVLTPAQVDAQIQGFRSQSVTFTDTVN